MDGPLAQTTGEMANLDFLIPQPKIAINDCGSLEINNHEALSLHAAAIIIDEIRQRPNLLLCTAAGSTPTRTYDLLVEKKQVEPHLFDQLRVLMLDEWGGLEMDNPATCKVYLEEHLIHSLGVSSERFIAFQSGTDDPHGECERLRTLLGKHTPIDLCILGLGTNGHLGLNEPAEALEAFVHITSLSETSLRHPMLEPVKGRVTYGLTLGMADILRSRKVLLLVSGKQKGKALRRLLTPDISPTFPASFLWLHPDVTVLHDRESVLDSHRETES
jgi:galactosamine-6-phosphate isomerase